ncbi:MAG: ribose-5-phosphate isomerase RpiA [Phycisphaerales bacterium]
MTTHDTLAHEAVAPIESGMLVGLGTGRAASRGIHALAARAHGEGLRVECVATSEASAALARELGLAVLPFSEVAKVDYLFDGADEVAPDLSMLKGRGGAMTREKIVAHACARCVYLIDESKLVDRLGSRFALPIETLPFALASVRDRLHALGLDGPVREAEGGATYHTDNGFLVIDAAIPENANVRAISEGLARIEGVLGHGLFLTEADAVLVESADRAKVTRMTRPA